MTLRQLPSLSFRFVKLVEDVQKSGGSVFIFSMAHVSGVNLNSRSQRSHSLSSLGEQLNLLSGIAAILRFPLPDIEEQEFNEEDLFS